MTSTQSLDINGDLRRNPLAELLIETAQAKLSGSLRLSLGDRKAIVYVLNGRVVHAVSNQREHRLFHIGLTNRRFTKDLLSKHPNFANDIEFSAELKKSGEVTAFELKDLAIIQIEQILIDTLSWTEGKWTYSPHARLRADLALEVDAGVLLLNYARCLPSSTVIDRFRSVQEVFSRNGSGEPPLELQQHEKYVLDRFAHGHFSIAQLKANSPLPESGLLQGLYSLWLCGLLERKEWTSGLAPNKLDAIKSARLARTAPAAALPVDTAPEKPQPVNTGSPEKEEPAKIAETDLNVDQYLEQVESAESYYALLGLTDKATLAEIKARYFTFAKNFHPDRFHREDEKKHSRIQHAFTQLAHAYETLKTAESREAYDFKLRKELEIKEKRKAAGKTEEKVDIQEEKGLESFESGLELYQDEDYAAAATHLARACHYSPQNALYHAYFGKALSYTGSKYYHKAEGELQQAVKLDPNSTKIRMMLVEFFIDIGMQKRAEGELRRFLAISPGNREAQDMMNRMQEMIA